MEADLTDVLSQLVLLDVIMCMKMYHLLSLTGKLLVNVSLEVRPLNVRTDRIDPFISRGMKLVAGHRIPHGVYR